MAFCLRKVHCAPSCVHCKHRHSKKKKKKAQGKKHTFCVPSAHRKGNGNLTEIRIDKRAKSLVQPQRPAELHGSSETIQKNQSMSKVLQRILRAAYSAYRAASKAQACFQPPLLAMLLLHKLQYASAVYLLAMI